MVEEDSVCGIPIKPSIYKDVDRTAKVSLVLAKRSKAVHCPGVRQCWYVEFGTAVLSLANGDNSQSVAANAVTKPRDRFSNIILPVTTIECAQMRLSLFVLLPLAPAVLSQTTNETLWGAYRPNLYFGLRPRIPKSLMTGFMWFGTQDYQSAASVFSINIFISFSN